MKAAYFINGEVQVGEMPDPEPGEGQALVRTHACGLCASDQHFLSGGQHIINLSRSMGGPYAALDFSRPFVPGHEFVGEVLDYGKGCERKVAPGAQSHFSANNARWRGAQGDRL